MKNFKFLMATLFILLWITWITLVFNCDVQINLVTIEICIVIFMGFIWALNYLIHRVMGEDE